MNYFPGLGFGYALRWAIHGGSATKGCNFYSNYSIRKSKEICRFSTFKGRQNTP